MHGTRLLVVSASDRPEVARASWTSWAAYARTHGYGFLPLDASGTGLVAEGAALVGQLSPLRSAHHLKLWLLHDLLESGASAYQTIVWVDDDVVATSMATPHPALALAEDTLAVDALPTFVAREPFNTGVVVATRGGDRASSLLRRAWLAPFATERYSCLLRDCGWWDNTALGLAVDADAAGFVLLPYGSLQAFWSPLTFCGTEWTHCEWVQSLALAWAPGDFAAHAGGGSPRDRAARMTRPAARPPGERRVEPRRLLGGTAVAFGPYREALVLALRGGRERRRGCGRAAAAPTAELEAAVVDSSARTLPMPSPSDCPSSQASRVGGLGRRRHGVGQRRVWSRRGRLRRETRTGAGGGGHQGPARTARRPGLRHAGVRRGRAAGGRRSERKLRARVPRRASRPGPGATAAGPALGRVRSARAAGTLRFVGMGGAAIEGLRRPLRGVCSRNIHWQV